MSQITYNGPQDNDEDHIVLTTFHLGVKVTAEVILDVGTFL